MYRFNPSRSSLSWREWSDRSGPIRLDLGEHQRLVVDPNFVQEPAEDVGLSRRVPQMIAGDHKMVRAVRLERLRRHSPQRPIHKETERTRRLHKRDGYVMPGGIRDGDQEPIPCRKRPED